MSQKSFTRFENQMKKRKHLESVQSGTGVFLYENNTPGTLMLPRRTKSGLAEVEPVDPKVEGSGRFQGDSYYKDMVRSNLLRLIKVIQPEDPPKTKEILLENDDQYVSKEKIQAGKGYFLYENNTKGTLLLPKPTASGVKMVEAVNPRIPGSGRFQGDDYYMSMVRNNMLRLVKTLRTPQQESIMPEKLILDQPETVTHAGTVEHVVSVPTNKPLNEEEKEKEKLKEVLLNENPSDDVEFFD